ncbi:MAG TPA: hypothetical protein VJU84_16630 [Pyrinomonadaceae bacterium]|nr:hypothetical protein [Pyrinomonadaceae bacterium]
MHERTNQVDPESAVEAFWAAANYISACLLYLKANPLLSEDLAFTDLKPRALGHWGCVPALNFIWASLLSVIRSTGADVRLFFGTGHSGAAWLACSYLEQSLSSYYDINDGAAGLEKLCASFGRTGGFLTELSAQYPGVLWPSGELGYTLGVSHGHALSTEKGIVLAVLGDGELETAATNAAFHGIKKFAARTSRLAIVVNLNGLRMGGPSEISTWTDAGIQKYFAAFELTPRFIEGFDACALTDALEGALVESLKAGPPSLIILRTEKGATMQRMPGGEAVVGTPRSHKVPLKTLRQPTDLEWLERWLRSYRPDYIFRNRQIDRTAFAEILPRDALLIGNAHQRAATEYQFGDMYRRNSVKQARPNSNAVIAFIRAIESEAEALPKKMLLTSPDELASNRLESINSEKVEIIEYLSEHQCLAWSIGAATSGRATWYTSYDAFAPIVLSMITQYLKFLDNIIQSEIPIVNQPLNVFLTSLGWRNTYTHQDPGFASAVLEKRSPSFRCFLPASSASVAAAVASCHRMSNAVSCIIADKHEYAWDPPKLNLDEGEPFTFVGEWGSDKPSIRIAFLVSGDYLVREAVFAAEAAAKAGGHIRTKSIVFEELTWLYRSGADCEAHRKEFKRLIADSDLFILITSLYEDVISSLVRHVLRPPCRMTTLGFRSTPSSVTPVGALLESRSSWIQIAAKALNETLYSAGEIETNRVLAAIDKLSAVEIRLRRDLEMSYDEPEWYWRLKPQDVLT